MDELSLMGIVEILGIATSVSLLSGWRFYLVVLATGIAMRSGYLPLPEHLESLAESMETGIDTLQDYIKLVDNPPVGQAKEHAQ